MENGTMTAQDEGETRLLCDAERQNWYLLPKDLTLPEGDFVLHQMGGVDVRVDAEFIDAWLVDRDAARAWLKERLAGTFKEGKQALMDALKRGLASEKSRPRNPEPAIPAPGTADGETLADAARALQRLATVLEEAASQAAAKLGDAAETLKRLADQQTADPEDTAAELEADRPGPGDKKH